jgi:(S)-mandelate dehydrogenase
MLRYGADAMLARVARDAGIGYIQSTVSTAAIEEIAAENLPQHWFQLYVLKDRTVTTGATCPCKSGRLHHAGGLR